LREPYATSALTPWHRLARPIPPTNARALHSCATHFREVVVLSHLSFLARCVDTLLVFFHRDRLERLAGASGFEYRFDGPVPLQRLLHEV